jgi:rubrerythrin
MSIRDVDKIVTNSENLQPVKRSDTPSRNETNYTYCIQCGTLYEGEVCPLCGETQQQIRDHYTKAKRIA